MGVGAEQLDRIIQVAGPYPLVGASVPRVIWKTIVTSKYWSTSNTMVPG
jgi:hypothetical protein